MKIKTSLAKKNYQVLNHEKWNEITLKENWTHGKTHINYNFNLNGVEMGILAEFYSLIDSIDRL